MKHFALYLLMSACLMSACLMSACQSPAERAADALARRIAPEYSFRFREVADTAERYTFYTKGSTLVVEGSTGSALTSGLGRYLKDFCTATVSWYADEPIALPRVQPRVETPVSGRALVPRRFFLNYCSFGYTMPWWKWEDWSHFIDWMALQGINLPLAITGQEAIWQEVWRQHGLSDEEIRAYFTGPAHLPWHRMCNIDGVDGPLPQGWIDAQKELQKKILKRERELGMKPILPAFSGHVPGKLKEIYPEAQITDVARWCRFPEENRCHFLSPEDSLYTLIQKQFLQAQTREFGTDHLYGFDLFNEVPPPSWEPEVLARIGKGAYACVAAEDPEAEWIQMGWLFYNDSRHWTPENIKAYLEAVPRGRVTILDYYTENVPVWKQTNSFYGQPYIFCYLGNFGGNTRLAGPFRTESQRISEALSDGGDNLQGIGCTLEGFGLNQWFYEYVLERAWESGPDEEWLRRLERRHGSPEGLWTTLADSIYVRGSFSEGPLICGRPCEKGFQHWTVVNHTPYNNETLARAWRKLLEEPSPKATYREDAITLGSQALGNHFAELRDAFVAACDNRQITEAEALSRKMRELLADAAALTTCSAHNRLDRWLEEASAWGNTPEEKAYYRHNAWILLTIWGETPSLNDYASRLWSGLIDHYYAPRWELFLQKKLSLGKNFSQEQFNEECRSLELELVKNPPLEADRPAADDAIELCRGLLRKWFPQELTLVSYNVGAFGKYPGSSVSAIARYLKESGAAFVALQETDSCNRRHNSFQVKDLALEMGGVPYHFASAFPFAGGAYGNGVVSREEVLIAASIPLPQADGSEPRSVAVVETARCVFSSAHLDHKSKAAALGQAQAINSWFREHYAGSRKPVFLCGDMNSLPESAVIEELLKEWTLLSGTAPTHSGKCIDYVFCLSSAAPAEAHQSRVDQDVHLSDHQPLTVKVRF